MSARENTPLSDGFHMPAEWELHEATWLSWPHPDGISFPGIYSKILPIFAKIVDALADSEEVRINVNDNEEERKVLEVLSGVRHDHVRFFHVPTNEPWCRDHGPMFLVSKSEGKLAAVDWGYNAWGYKYPPFDLDDAVPGRLAEILGLKLYSPDMILEGGSIDVNGEGALMTTESCLLHPNRNPEMKRKDIEWNLREFIGAKQVIWLGDGIAGDDTDGHVDDIARFVGPRHVLLAREDDSEDENYTPLRDNRERLENIRIHGKPLTIDYLPMPAKLIREGMRLPASYANFYIANKVVLMPAFCDPSDKLAAAILQKCFPEREIVAIDSRDLVWGLGAFHCLTQQQPAAPTHAA